MFEDKLSEDSFISKSAKILLDALNLKVNKQTELIEHQAADNAAAVALAAQQQQQQSSLTPDTIQKRS